MPPNNPAGRLLELFQAAQRANGRLTAVDAWAEVFQMPTAGIARDREVARLLTLAGDQVTALRAAAKRLGAADDYLHRIDAVEQFLSVRHLGHNWDQAVKPHLTEATAAVLESYAGLIPEDEARIPASALADATTMIAKLREQIEKAELPPAVKMFLLRQVALMERAMREYPIRGAPAFREATDAAAADWVESAPSVAPYENAPEVQAVKHGWERVDTWATRGLLYGHLATFIWGTTSPLLRIAAEHHLLNPTVAAFIQPFVGDGATGSGRRLTSGSGPDVPTE